MVKWFKPAEKAPPPPVVDRDYLARLSKHIGHAETCELMADGAMELSDKLDRLRRIVDGTEEGSIAELAHDIAGAAGHLGLSALSMAAVDANRLAREDGAKDARDLADRIFACEPEAMSAIAKYCANEDADDLVPETPD